MTNGPPSSAASSSKTPSLNNISTPIPQSPTLSLLPSSSSSTPSQLPYANYAAWNNMWTSPYSGSLQTSSISPAVHPTAGTKLQSPYPNMNSNPYAAHIFHTQAYMQAPLPENASSFMKTNAGAVAKAPPVRASSPTPPPLPEPETFKDWDRVIKEFLVRTKMTQTLKGLENDMLVLNPEWEQQTVPEALKEMVVGLQKILEKVAGKKKAEDEAMDTDADVDITTTTEPNGDRSLDERKLHYISLANGAQPRPQSSINKSISQFLARTRARNDASNRAEFLYTLAEKKRKLQEGGQNPAEVEFTSCARVDAKPIDRDKQMKYDIAKNGEGPLTKTVKLSSGPGPSSELSSENANSLSAPPSLPRAMSGVSTTSSSDKTTHPQPQSRQKRKFVDFDESHVDTESAASISKAKNKAKGKGKQKEENAILPDTELDNDEDAALGMLTAEEHLGLDERLKNVEEHLALRYVPSPPRTLLSRLKYLEDHLIKLEKEYPPWAALHFNQPNRGWPPPPRATPIIVPPHLRSTAALHNPTSASHVTTSTPGTYVPSNLSATVQSGSMNIPVKTRKSTSSLHKAVLDRLEVQKAMSEMSGRGVQG
ncbi:hypothetical protein BDZ97DRAFT_1788284 [Flammula alnicola]|nr:hypothetical protein BDZ97DRAFT_1788284 [Flammula alnicola]